MQQALHSVNFTDKKLLNILDKRNIAARPPGDFYGRGFLGEVNLSQDSSIKGLFEHFPPIAGLQSRDLVILSFYDKNIFIGEFSFYAQRSLMEYEIILYYNDSRFLDDFGSLNTFLSKSASLERLMEYPLFGEWLIWNKF
jgi:hypothetical protein